MTPGLIGFESLSDAAPLAEMVLGLMPDAAVMVVDSERRVVAMRGAAYERHGYDLARSIGSDLHDVIPAAAWARLGEHWGAALAGESRTLDFEAVDGESVCQPLRRTLRSGDAASTTAPALPPVTVTVAAWGSAGRPVGSQPRPGGARISVCALAPTNASCAALPDHSSSPTLAFERRDGGRRVVDDDPDLREAGELGGGEVAGGTGSLGRAGVGDQLDDVAGRVVEVHRPRVPEVEREDGLAVVAGERFGALAQPRARGVEAVAGHEQREVVERIGAVAGGDELEHVAADRDDDPAVAPLDGEAQRLLVEAGDRLEPRRRHRELRPCDPQRHRAEATSKRSLSARLNRHGDEAATPCRHARSQRRAVGAHRARDLAAAAPLGARRLPRARLPRRDDARDRRAGGDEPGRGLRPLAGQARPALRAQPDRPPGRPRRRRAGARGGLRGPGRAGACVRVGVRDLACREPRAGARHPVRVRASCRGRSSAASSRSAIASRT